MNYRRVQSGAQVNYQIPYARFLFCGAQTEA
jgi:hypothetical protein